MAMLPPPTNFQYFPRLPPELRMQIWAYFHNHTPSRTHVYLSISPTVRLEEKFAKLEWPQFFFYEWKAHIPQIPAILHVCHESREFGLKHYSIAFDFSYQEKWNHKIAFAARYGGSTKVPEFKDPRGVYWNKAKDLLTFRFKHVVILRPEDDDFLWNLRREIDPRLCTQRPKLSLMNFGVFNAVPRGYIGHIFGAEVLFINLSENLRTVLGGDCGQQKRMLDLVEQYAWLYLGDCGYKEDLFGKLKIKSMWTDDEARQIVDSQEELRSFSEMEWDLIWTNKADAMVQLLIYGQERVLSNEARQVLGFPIR